MLLSAWHSLNLAALLLLLFIIINMDKVYLISLLQYLGYFSTLQMTAEF